MIRHRFASATIVAVLSLLAASSTPQSCQAQPGPAPFDTAIADYIVATGEIIVSVSDVVNWYVESASASLTGPDEASAVLPAGGGIFTGNDANDERTGELNLGGMTYTDVNLGAIAATSLPSGDLKIFWSAVLGGDESMASVNYIGGPGGQPGDFNDDTNVLGDDFIVWQRGGTTPPLDAGLLGEWEANYGTVAASVSASVVPEPAALSLILLGSLAFAGRPTRRG